MNRLKVLTIVGNDSYSCCIWGLSAQKFVLFAYLSFIYLLPYLLWYVCLSFKTQCNTWQIKWTVSSSYYFLPQRQWPSQKCFEQALIYISYILPWGLTLMVFCWFLSFASFGLSMWMNKQVHQVWWHTLAMPAYGELRQEDHDSSRPA